jgi:polar amino acid transport system permease protein
MAHDLDTSLYEPIQLYSAAGLLYFIINRALAFAGTTAERRLHWGRA